MKDLFFKDLSYKVLSKYCGKKKAHPHPIHSYTGVVRPKIYPTTETKGRGTPIARRILILRSSECKESLLSKLPSAILHLQRYCKNQR